MPGFLPVLGGTEKEARDKLALLDSWTDQSKVIGMLSDRLGHDVSKYDLDGPLPELPVSEQIQSRAKLLTDAARRDNLTLRQLAQMVATGRGHFVMCGTPEQIADRMEEWFRAGGADGFNVMPPYFPGGLDDFAAGVIPILQKRGLFRTEYEGTTLRDHFGFSRPPNRHRSPAPRGAGALGLRTAIVSPRFQEQEQSCPHASSSSRPRMPKSPRSPARWRRPASSWSCRAPIAPTLEPALPTAEYMVCYPNVRMRRRVLSRGAEAQALSAAQRRLRRRRSRGGAARQGAGLQQRRRQRDLGVRARDDADARGVAPGDLAARQRLGRALARQRAGAARCTSCSTRRSASSASAPSARRWRGSRRAFGMRVQYYDIARLPEHEEDALGVRFRLLRELLRTLRHRHAARAAQRFHPPHDRRERARADEARGDHRQHQPRPGDRRGGAHAARSPTTSCSAPASTCSTRSRRRPTIRCSSSTTWC